MRIDQVHRFPGEQLRGVDSAFVEDVPESCRRVVVEVHGTAAIHAAAARDEGIVFLLTVHHLLWLVLKQCTGTIISFK